MKSIHILMSVLSLLFVLSCAPTIDYVSIEINLLNNEAETATISGYDYEKEFTHSNEIFKDTFHIPQDGIYSLRIGKIGTDLYLVKGENIVLDADFTNFLASAEITGKNKNILRYNARKQTLVQDLLSRDIYKLDQESFSQRISDVQDSLFHALDKNTLIKPFAAVEKRSINHMIAEKKFIYTRYFLEDDTEKITALQDPLQGIDLYNEDEFLHNRSYRNLVQTHFGAQPQLDTTLSYEENFRNRIAALPQGRIKNQLLYNDMRYIMGPNEDLKTNYDFFVAHNSDPKQLSEMMKKYDSLKKLSAGNMSPSFNYENYIGGKTSLENLAGKYVYVDVWATWCGPCLGEIPSLKEVEEKYHDKNIEFVSISIDQQKDHEKWKNMVKEKSLGGIQLFADNDWKSQFVADYQINGIPRFILIDPQGKIVSASAPRPSDPKLIDKLTSLEL